MKREIIRIDEERCNGCGLCLPNCPEGALQLIDGKVRLVSDLFCDGLGACVGHCPLDAITIEEREAEPYDERKTMENIVKQGEGVIKAHLQHLREHNQQEYLDQALEFLREKGMATDFTRERGDMKEACGCPGAQTQDFRKKTTADSNPAAQASELRQWPVQLHLVSPGAPYYRDADVVLSADCVAYALGDFHRKYLKGKGLAIACPKLDEGQEVYLEKLKALMDEAKIKTLTVMIMQVPCCRGLLNLAKEAVAQAKRKMPVKAVVVGLQGEILSGEWV